MADTPQVDANYAMAPGYKPLEHMSDADLEYLFNTRAQTGAQLQTLSDEDLQALLGDYTAPGGFTVEEPPAVETPPPELTTGEALAGGARELAGGALFEFADEAEAAARAPFSDKTYDQLVNDIRLERAKFGEAYPATATALNLAGGVGSMFIPGVGAAGKAIQGATGISKLASPLARTTANAALAGGVSGFGSGEGLSDSLGNAVVGATIGAPIGAAMHGAGQGVRWAREARGARGAGLSEEEAAQRAATIISRRLTEGNLAPDEARGLVELAQRYGIETAPFGMASPELARLTENVVQAPSGGRADLTRQLFETQAAAPTRVKSLVREAVPTPDYFASEEQVLKTLRTNAEQNYGSGWKNAEVRDPRILKVMNDPAIRSAYADALGNSRLQQQEAILRGEDPSQYKLREIFEPVLNEEGALVGLSPTGKERPNMGTLNEVKIALDRKISSLYASGQGGQATALRGLRDAFVSRLDDIGPPEYKAARQQYKGDIEIKEALEQGRNSGGLRYQQFGKLMRDYTPGEQQAFKTGFIQQVMQGFENTGNSRNFAKDLLKENTRRKFQAVMDPGEFQVFEAALNRESEMFNEIGRTTQGSATFGRAAEKADIENQIAGGNVEGALDLVLNPSPGNIARRTVQMLANMRNANVSRATYTQLARMLKASTPAELDDLLGQLERAVPPQRAADQALEGRATKLAAGVASSMAPPPEDTRGQLPETTDIIVPSLDEGPLGVPGTPIGSLEEPQTRGGPPPKILSEAGDALSNALGQGLSVWTDGRVEMPSGVFMEARDVAKLLGLPLAAWRAMAGTSGE